MTLRSRYFQWCADKPTRENERRRKRKERGGGGREGRREGTEKWGKKDLIFNVSDVKGVNTHTVADSKLPMVSWLLTLSKLVKAGSSTRFQRLGDWLSGEVTYPGYPARGGRPEIVTQVCSRWMPAPSFRTVTRKFEYICKRGRVREWKEKKQGGNVRGRHCLLKEQEPWPPAVLGSSPAFPCQLHGLEWVLSLS